MVTTLLAVRGFRERTDDAFRRELVALAKRRQLNPSYLAAVMSFETGATFDPAIRNPSSSATGLIQFMGSTARMLGTTTEELASMTQLEQLAYVERYFERIGRALETVSDHYMAVFAPSGIGKPSSFPLYSAPSSAYEANQALDKDGDGVISVGDASAPVEGIVAQARRELPIIVSDEPSAPPSSPGGAVTRSSSGFAALFAVGAGLWAWLRNRRR